MVSSTDKTQRQKQRSNNDRDFLRCWPHSAHSTSRHGTVLIVKDRHASTRTDAAHKDLCVNARLHFIPLLCVFVWFSLCSLLRVSLSTLLYVRAPAGFRSGIG